MNAGPSENGIGGNGRIVLTSYTLTSGSGKGLPCLHEKKYKGISESHKKSGCESPNEPESPANRVDKVAARL